MAEERLTDPYAIAYLRIFDARLRDRHNSRIVAEHEDAINALVRHFGFPGEQERAARRVRDRSIRNMAALDEWLDLFEWP